MRKEREGWYQGPKQEGESERNRGTLCHSKEWPVRESVIGIGLDEATTYKLGTRARVTALKSQSHSTIVHSTRLELAWNSA